MMSTSTLTVTARSHGLSNGWPWPHGQSVSSGRLSPPSGAVTSEELMVDVSHREGCGGVDGSSPPPSWLC